MDIGKKIAELRKGQHLTQKELAEKSGVDYNTLIKIESGKTKEPGIKTIEKLASGLGVLVDQIHAGDKEEKVQVQGQDILPFTKIPSSGQFEKLIYWIAVRDKNYKNVGYCAGTGDRQRDVKAELTSDKSGKSWVCFQAKRYLRVDLGIFTKELDGIKENIENGIYTRPSEIIFCVACGVSPTIKDDAKKYVEGRGLPEPIFWCEVELDEKCKNSLEIMNQFFGGHMDEIKVSLKKREKTDQEHGQLLRDIKKNVDQQNRGITALASATSDEQNDAELKRTKHLVNTKKYADAEALLISLRQRLESIKDYKRLAKALNFLGVCKLNGKPSGDYLQSALELFKESLGLDPDYEVVKINIASVYLNMGGSDGNQKARSLLSSIKNLDPDKELLRKSLWIGMLMNENAKEEIKKYLDELKGKEEAYATHEQLINNIGFASLIRGDIEHALKCSDLGLKESPDSFSLHALKGRSILAAAQKKYPEKQAGIIPDFKDVKEVSDAEILLEKAIRLAIKNNAEDSSIDLIRADLYLCGVWLDKIDDEKYRELKKDMRLSNLSEQTRHNISVADFYNSLRKKEFEKAYTVLLDNEHFEEIPYSEKKRLAAIFLQYGSPEHTLRLLQQIKDDAIEEHDIQYWFMSSTAHSMLGQKNDAITTITEAKRYFPEGDPEHSNLLAHANAIHLRAGEIDRMIPDMMQMQREKPKEKILVPIKAIEEDGSLSGELKSMLTSAKEKFENAKKIFRDNPYPIYFLQKLYNRSYPEISDWGVSNGDLDFHVRYLDANPAFIKMLRDHWTESKEAILDYATWLNLARMGLLGLLQGSDKTILVHRTLFDQIQQDLIQNESADLRSVWDFMRKEAKIIDEDIVNGILDAKTAPKVFDKWIIQTLRLAQKNKSLFVSDDLILLKHAESEGIKSSNSFGIIKSAYEKGRIDKKIYSESIGSLAERLYVFIPFDAEDLLTISLDDIRLIDLRKIPCLRSDDISVRFNHLLGQMVLPGSSYMSFLLVFFNFLDRLWDTGALQENKLRYLGFVSSRIIEFCKEKISLPNPELERFISLAWGMAIKKSPIKELDDLKTKMDSTLSQEKELASVLKELQSAIKKRHK